MAAAANPEPQQVAEAPLELVTASDLAGEHDYLIVGAGPGGMQMAYFFEQAGWDYLLLEAGPEPAQFFTQVPRHRRMISFNRIHSFSNEPEVRQRFDWNSLLTEDDDFLMRDFSEDLYPLTDDLRRYLCSYAATHLSQIQFDARATRISRRADGRFLVELADGRRYGCRNLIMATGAAQRNWPDFPGVELTEHYQQAPNTPEAYAGQRVLIIGGGQSAFELADIAMEKASYVEVAIRHQRMTLGWHTHHSGHVRGAQSRILDTFNLKMLNIIGGSIVTKVERRPDGALEAEIDNSPASKGEWEKIVFDRIVCCTGFRFDDSVFADDCRPELTLGGRWPALSSMWESTNVPNLFFVGTLTQSRDYRKAASTFIAGFRYNTRTLFKLLEERDRGVAYPCEQLPRDGAPLADVIAERYSRNAALFTQFGFLCDALVDDGETITHYRELPFAYARERFAGAKNLYLLTMEWGDSDASYKREVTYKGARKSKFLHPVVHHYRGGKERAVFRLLEDIVSTYGPGLDEHLIVERLGKPVADWHHEHHVQPLAWFFDKTFKRGWRPW